MPFFLLIILIALICMMCFGLMQDFEKWAVATGLIAIALTIWFLVSVFQTRQYEKVFSVPVQKINLDNSTIAIAVYKDEFNQKTRIVNVTEKFGIMPPEGSRLKIKQPKLFYLGIMYFLENDFELEVE